MLPQCYRNDSVIAIESIIEANVDDEVTFDIESVIVARKYRICGGYEINTKLSSKMLHNLG